MLHAVVTSDWHLEGLSKHFPVDHIDRQLNEIDKIYQYALSRGIHHVIVPGDITDRHHCTDSTKSKLLAFFRKYDGIIHTWYVGGNHDRADINRTSVDLFKEFCEWDFFKTLHIFTKPEQVEIEGIVCNMLPHPSVEAIKHKKRACLNFVHTDIVGAIGDNGRALKTTKTVKTNEGDFTIGGHIHLHQYLKKQQFLLCGNPFQKNFGESLPKGWVEIKAKYKKSGELKVDWQFVESRPDFVFETVVIKESSQFSALKVSPGIRYRLYVAEDVVVPNDLKVTVPNIAQLHRVKGSVAKNLEEKMELGFVAVDTINPKEGLKEFMVSYGLNKTERTLGRNMLREALSEIGLQ